MSNELNLKIEKKLQPVELLVDLLFDKKTVPDDILNSARHNLADIKNDYIGLEEQLIQSEKLATVGTLSGGVAHEINNPLSAILMNVQMLLIDAEDNPSHKESLALIEEATQRCRSILKKMMTYQRNPIQEEKFLVIDLHVIIKKVLAFLKHQLNHDKISIKLEVTEGQYCVLACANEIEQVLTNLILNARDATKELRPLGTVIIRLYKETGFVKVEIQDEGIGIAEEVVANVFDPYFTTKNSGKGLGLGLSISQTIIKKYSGELYVRSFPKTGSIFTIRFPECLKGVE
jgi:two-component system NtrC family sensor kinase